VYDGDDTMTRKLGYMLYSGPVNRDMRLMVPGLFLWAAAFEKHGKFGQLSTDIKKESLENFDVVHVNYTPTNASYISAIRDALGDRSSTKLVANVDFGTKMWNRMDPLVMKEMLNKADCVFHVESNGANRLSRLLGKTVHVIPHPTDIESIAKGRKKERSTVISCQYHRYEDTWQEYYYGLINVRKEYDELHTILMNYTPPKATEMARVPIVCLFDAIAERMSYSFYIEHLSKSLINVDVTNDFTYGRGIVDAAALGVPTVGSNTIEAQRVIWPELAITPGKDMIMEKAVQELLEDESLRDDMAQQGIEKCEDYSLENSYANMMMMVGES
jgi:glycosyltransferase involved in cell wall biosynthesis